MIYAIMSEEWLVKCSDKLYWSRSTNMTPSRKKSLSAYWEKYLWHSCLAHSTLAHITLCPLFHWWIRMWKPIRYLFASFLNNNLVCNCMLKFLQSLICCRCWLRYGQPDLHWGRARAPWFGWDPGDCQGRKYHQRHVIITISTIITVMWMTSSLHSDQLHM